MAAWQMDAYFPAAYRQWKQATGADKERLDREFGIQKQLDDVVYHFRNTVFVEFLVEEMARFFKCKPVLKDVIAARNEYNPTRLLEICERSVRRGPASRHVCDLGVGRLDASGHRPRRIFTLGQDPRASHLFCRSAARHADGGGYFADEALSRNEARLRQEITQNGNLGFKSHIATRAGLDVQAWSRQEVEEAWQQYKKLSAEERRRESQGTLRPESAKKIRQYLFWQACGIAYELDVPFTCTAATAEKARAI
jgi:hypothetical protein